jgi:hypothetical protein
VTKKLILLNLALLALLGLVCWRFRQQYRQMKAHEVAVLGRKLQSAPPPALAALPKPEKLQATSYLAVAAQNLFSKDRDPNEIPDPPKPPPPPPPVPAFPAARGVMLWQGEPPTVLLSEQPGGSQKGYHPGDRIGPWKILAVTNQHVTFEWEGKQFQKRIDELLDKTLVAKAEPPPSVAPNAPQPQTKSLSETKTGMGVDVGGGQRAASCTDGVAPGTVLDGYVRMASQNPMTGQTCYWQKK